VKVALVTLTALGLLLGGTNNKARSQERSCRESREAIVFYRHATWSWQDKLGAVRTRTAHSERWSHSCAYLRWAARLWIVRSNKYRQEYRRVGSDPKTAIRIVFGRYADQALSVSYCETGGTYSVYASNGQYLGLFQMGSYARSRYGHSNSPIGQARAAYAYFADSGYDWSPWECKP
jgi:hypothetical protein